MEEKILMWTFIFHVSLTDCAYQFNAANYFFGSLS